MQQISPKDRPKLIALGVGVVAVFGFAIKTTMDSLNSVAGAPSPAAGVTTAGATAPPTTAGVVPAAPAPDATTPEANSETYVLKSNYPDNRGRDPFTPVSDSEFAKHSVKITTFATPPPPPQITTGGTGALSGGTMRMLRNGLKGFENRKKTLDQLDQEMGRVGNTPPVPRPVVKVLPPPPPPYTVIGVLIGEPGGRDVAILTRNATTDKKFVVAGDALEGGYTVTAIDSGGVRVTHPGRRPMTTDAEPIPVGGSTEYYLPKQTTVVPATSMTLPLGASPNPGTSTNVPGAK